MREYKYRGKPTDNNTTYSEDGEFVYGSLVINNDKYYIVLGINDNIDRDDYEVYMVEVIPETIGQYTGLKDKNKKEIYEGDILKYAGGGIYVVVFDEMMIMCPQDKIEMPSPGYYGILIGDKAKELCPLGITQRLARAIGNIYDNPELLEEGGNKL